MLRARPFILAVLALLPACQWRDATPASEVSGNYDVRYDNQLKLTLQLGGVRYEGQTLGDGTAEFRTSDRGVLRLDLNAFCARPEVQCPSELLWQRVSIHQPQIRSTQPNSHVLNVIDNSQDRADASHAPGVLAGWVDEYDRFVLLLGASSQSNEQCGLLNISLAGGRFVHEGERLVPNPPPMPRDAGAPDTSTDASTDGDTDGSATGDASTIPLDADTLDAAHSDAATTDADTDAGTDAAVDSGFRVVWDRGSPVTGITEGRVATAFLGACAFGPVAIGAVLTIETGYEATRTGPFDPPPNVRPIDPAQLDGGVDPDAMTAPDAGLDGGHEAGLDTGHDAGPDGDAAEDASVNPNG